VKIQYGEQALEAEVAEGVTLLEVIRDAGLPFSAPCGGKGSCGKCEVLAQDDGGTRKVLACRTAAAGVQQIAVTDATAGFDLELLHHAVDGHEFGVAIDLGTTTIAAELVDLQTGDSIARMGHMNPQSVYGADVISRIEAAQTGQLETMNRLIVDALGTMITQLCTKASVASTSLRRITLAGNTIMEHLAAGLSPESIGVYPYKPLDLFGRTIPLWNGLPPVWFAPCISGYVGGDVVAGMLSKQPLPTLLIDLGTNGEIALQTRELSVAAATAAGPVFEGMNVRYGMPALPGAIKRVRYDEVSDELFVETIGGMRPLGICGSGLVDLLAILLLHDLVDESGRLLTADESSSPLASRLLSFEDEPAFKLLAASDIVVTQKDIRNLQLAKAAIAAGIETVLDTADLARTQLASLAIGGGFGQHIDKDHAAVVGLIPAALLHKAVFIGNSSLNGMRKALLNPALRQRMISLAQTTRYVELSTDTRFSESFIENMGFE
jgi:uncharacterized 2Fe-2S/4Fe-4S cluster protein (DUF4445 family)